MTRYVSTRGGVEPLTFKEAVMSGLARDGGLLMPERVPSAAGELERWRKLPYADLAFEVMRLFADDIGASDLRGLVEKSYGVFRHPEVTPTVPVGPVHVLELFHGPTLAFKDVALQFLGNLFEHILSEAGGFMNIVAATSGDTGSAAIHGVRGRGRMRIFVMHPRGRVSPVQELQMTTVTDANVHNLAVEGTFDDCQNIVKDLFNDLAFRDECGLGAVNSINWARVLAQIVYYFYAAFRVMDKTGADKVSFTVPTGNFGDVFAGYMACRMGLPVERLVLATNENDILARYFNTGEYRTGAVAATLSPSMDIQVASNFERYLYCLAEADPRQVKQWMGSLKSAGSITTPGACHGCMAAGRGDTAETLFTIREFWERHNYLLDPHSAVGVAVGARFLKESVPMICLATAHPAKFGEAILRATGQDLARHPLIDKLRGLPTRLETAPADTAAVAAIIRRAIAEG
ncbi:MAG: threonine synthase [Kiritimatiellae bacterium]|nr:threonine synthase [Kiritimatiellia bacterium]MDD3545776.1 threonine synthase [Kiritimatiellia bacterium]MDD4024681.1 threonine synthase [Kiritimatiellia bacterium]